MNIKRFVVATIAVIFTVGSVHAADVRASVVTDLGLNQASGYRPPFAGFGVGLDFQNDHLLLQAHALQSWTDKFEYRSLSQAYGKGRALVGVGRVVVGGGITHSRLRFGETGEVRSATRPFASGGYMYRNRSMILGEWVFPGWDGAYSLSGPVLVMETQPKQHLRVALEISYLRFHNRALNYSGGGFEVNVYTKLFL